MDLALASSRGGSPVCRADGLYLHSPYAPEREAERFIESRIGGRSPTAIVLLAPCLDYLSPRLRARFPGAAIIALQPHPFFRGKEMGGHDAAWYPDSSIALANFLERSVDEDALAGLAVLEWPPGARAFPESVARFREALRSVLDRLAGSAATLRTFGRRWFANACRSYLLIERIAIPPFFAGPIVLAAAGPSLGSSLRALAPYRGGFTLIAVSSALTACRAAGTEPDLVIATDGGFWSRGHLYPLARRSCLLAAPLTALPSSQLWQELPIVLLDQQSFVESELLPLLGESLRLPSHGTVAGSALLLAARLSQGPIIAAGLDLAVRGEREHASPHAFDVLLSAGAGRLAPCSTASYARILDSAPHPTRSDEWRSSRSLESYADALGFDAHAFPGRLFRLDPSPVELSGFVPIGVSDLPGLLSRVQERIGPVATSAAPPIGRRHAHLRRAFARWKRAAKEGAALLASGEIPRDPFLRELYRFFDLPDWAAAGRASIAGTDPAGAARVLGERTYGSLAEIERRLLG
ncbi:MAG: 6-hydroxymethylpterin diphosphokinase MptE-like protein [Rectinemataceae bacterium]